MENYSGEVSRLNFRDLCVFTLHTFCSPSSMKEFRHQLTAVSRIYRTRRDSLFFSVAFMIDLLK